MIESPIERVLPKLKGVTGRKPQWSARCPSHDDKRASLSVHENADGQVLLRCQTGCSFEDVIGALGLRPAELFPPTPGHIGKNGAGSKDEVTRYDYTCEQGKPLFQKRRYFPKTFLLYRWENNAWVSKLGDTRRVLYRLPEVLAAATAGRIVFLVEGEKDADNLAALGFCATTNFEGASQDTKKPKWRDDYSKALTGAKLVIIPDNDDTGRAHAANAARESYPYVESVRILEMPGVPYKGDVSDWLADGGDADQLKKMVGAAPLWEPAALPATVSAPVGTTTIAEVKATEPEDRQPSVPDYPDSPTPEAFHGLAGDIVRAMDPFTEADRVAVLVQLLAAFGNAVQRAPHFSAGADDHYLGLFVLLVGQTAGGRKGSSWSLVRRLMTYADDGWTKDNVSSGLSSGEGLIWAVRDPIEKQHPIKEKGRVTGYETVVDDPGVSDKRFCVIEQEFAGTLKVMDRDGNILSAVLRQAWDTGTLRITTKNTPAKATDAHITVIAHITRGELGISLARVNATNGFLNRFLTLAVRRSKCLPDGAVVPGGLLSALGYRLQQALDFGRKTARMERDEAASGRWRQVYPELTRGRLGLLGAALSRGEAQTMRLACLYALLDQSGTVRLEHLEAALALWRYVEASASYVFGELLGNPDLDKLYAAIRDAGESGMARTAIMDLFKRNKSNAEINALLAALAEQDMARPRREQNPNGGRPAEIWVSTATPGTRETNNPPPPTGRTGNLVSFVPEEPVGVAEPDAWPVIQ